MFYIGWFTKYGEVNILKDYISKREALIDISIFITFPFLSGIYFKRIGSPKILVKKSLLIGKTFASCR